MLMLMTDVDIDDNDYAYVQGGLWVYIGLEDTNVKI